MRSSRRTVNPVLLSELRGPVEILSLNRPERRNAMLPELMDALAERLDRATHPTTLTGAGRAFCVGADLKWLAATDDPALAVAQLVARHHAAVRSLLDTPVPVIAAINGPTAGGGLSLALASDYRIAGASATFTAAYFRLGLTPDGGTSLFLPRTIGLTRTLELLMTNRTVGAAEAHEWGLVNEVVPDEQLLDRACEVAAAMRRVPAQTLRTTRRLLDAASGPGLETQLQREAVAMRAAARQPAFRSALRAFLEGRSS